MKLFRAFKSDLIEFYCDEELFGAIPEPVPAYKCMPDWFKKIPTELPNTRDVFGGKVMTAKKCLPLVDAMSLGFVIPLCADINVRVKDDGSLIDVPRGQLGPVIEFHTNEQLGGRTSPTYPGPAIKFINKWVIKTAPGYSTLFVPPLNSVESRFVCLSGMVDTDEYPKEVNFPAIWLEKGHDAILKSGTPLVTCIPIKRSQMPRTATIRAKTKAEVDEIELIRKKQALRRNVYTVELREAREK